MSAATKRLQLHCHLLQLKHGSSANESPPYVRPGMRGPGGNRTHTVCLEGSHAEPLTPQTLGNELVNMRGGPFYGNRGHRPFARAVGVEPTSHGFGDRCAPRRNPFARIRYHTLVVAGKGLNQIFWEAFYDDGWASSELGHRYGQLNRDALRRFSLRTNSRILVSLDMTSERPGNSLIYRRRSTLGNRGLLVSYLVGWVPQGPLWAVEESSLAVFTSPRFVPGDRLLHPAEPIRHEGELWDLPSGLVIP